MPKARQQSATPVTALLRELHIAFTTHHYEHDPRARSFGIEAASALDLNPDQVFKTLITTIDGTCTVAVVPVNGSVDMKALASCHGGHRAELANQALAERITGYVVGGISPIAHKRPLPTVIDQTVELFATVYVSGGKRGLEIGIAPQDLIRVTCATIAAIARLTLA